MSDIARGTVIGALVAVVLAGFVVALLDVLRAKERPDRPAAPGITVARIGPDGTAKSFFGEGLTNEAISGSRDYDLCFGELRVRRPPMMTSSMPDSFCTVTRRGKGAWRVSTGGWQQCQVVCVRLSGG